MRIYNNVRACTYIHIHIYVYSNTERVDMPAHAQQKRDRHIYIYTHHESLVRNHEPRAKALVNNNTVMGGLILLEELAAF